MDTDLNWEALNNQSVELDHLDAPFTLSELKTTVDGMHGGKAPGPDGFIGNFFKKCWPFIHLDLNQMHSLRGKH